MDHEVAKRLSALESKLAGLEHELTLIGRRRQHQSGAEHQSIDLAELARFRDTLRITMDWLTDEYSRLLSQTPASPPSPIAGGRRSDE